MPLKHAIPVSEAYDELMHYTSWAGFQGIVASGCLWATDSAFLNDATEINLYFDMRLRSVIGPVIRARGVELASKPDFLATMIESGGFEHCVAMETDKLVRNLKEVTIGVNRPFITSLCGAADERIAQSGLLSQWRGYGQDGGLAIVFDTKAIEKRLMDEAEQFGFLHIQMADVYYDGIEPRLQPATEDFRIFEDAVQLGLDRLLRGTHPNEMPDLYQAVTSLSCLCKHWGFWEEREVRIVAVLPHANKEQLNEDGSKRSRPVKHFPRGNAEIPYIELLASQGEAAKVAKIPIRRVIVGPGQEAERRTNDAREYMKAHGYDVPVTRSQIPFLGR